MSKNILGRTMIVALTILTLAPQAGASTVLYTQDFTAAPTGQVFSTSGSLPFSVAPRMEMGAPVSSDPFSLNMTVDQQIRAVWWQSPDVTPSGPNLILEFNVDGANEEFSNNVYSALFVEASVDGGGTWNQVTTGSDSLAAPPPAGFPDIGYSPGLNQITFRNFRVDLSTFYSQGQSIRVRIGVASCTGAQSFPAYPTLPGLAIDDIVLIEDPDIPAGTNASAGNTTALFYFQGVPNASGYRLYRSTDGVNQTVIADNYSLTAYQDTNLNSSTTYFYSVSALSPDGVPTDRSADASLTTTAPLTTPDPIRVELATANSTSIKFYGPAMTTGTAGGPSPVTSYIWEEFNVSTQTYSYIATTTDNELWLSKDTLPLDGGKVLFVTVRAVQGSDVGPR